MIFKRRENRLLRPPILKWFLNAIGAVKETIKAGIVHITDALAAPVVMLVAEFSPQQDLHGQDAPYPAGGGKNKLDINNPLSSSSAVSVQNNVIVGTNGYSYNGIVYEVSGLTVGSPYYASVVVKTNTTGYRIAIFVLDGGTGESYTNSTGTIGFSFNPTSETVQIKVEQRANGNWSADQLQLETGSSKTDFAPYSNICPITGHTGANVYRTGKNLLEPKFYGGLSYNISVGSKLLTTLTDLTNTVTKTGNVYTKSGSGWEMSMNMMLPLDKSFVGQTLKFSGSVEASGYRSAYYVTDADYIVRRKSDSMNEQPTWRITVEDGDAYLFWFINSSNTGTLTLTEPQIELGLTATTYEEYKGQTIPITFPNKNKFDGTFLQGYWAYADGAFTSSNAWVTTEKIPCKPSTYYTASASEKLTRWQGFVWYDSNGTFISTSNEQANANIGLTKQSPSNAAFMVFNIAGYPNTNSTISPSDVTHFQIEEGQTATAYEDSAIYGGTLTNGGGEWKLVVDRAKVKLNQFSFATLSSPDIHVFRSSFRSVLPDAALPEGNELWGALCDTFSYKPYSPISREDNGKYAISPYSTDRIVFIDHRFDTVEAFEEANANVEIVYPLEEPTTYTLTESQALTLLKGENNIWVDDSDSLELTYYAKAEETTP